MTVKERNLCNKVLQLAEEDPSVREYLRNSSVFYSRDWPVSSRFGRPVEAENEGGKT